MSFRMEASHHVNDVIACRKKRWTGDAEEHISQDSRLKIEDFTVLTICYLLLTVLALGSTQATLEKGERRKEKGEKRKEKRERNLGAS